MPKDLYFEDEDNLITADTDKMEEETWDDGDEEVVADIAGLEDEEDEKADLGLVGEEDSDEL